MAEHRREEAEVGERRCVAEQKRTRRDDRLEGGERAQVDALDVRARARRHAVAADVAAELSPADAPSA